MGFKWFPTEHEGIRYREHPARTYRERGVGKKARPERFYGFRYSFDGKRYEESVGWESEGITLDVAVVKLAELRNAQRLGKGAATLAETKEENRQAKLDEAKQNITFGEVALRYLAEKKNVISTWGWNDRNLRLHILPYLGHKSIKQILPSDIEVVRTKCLERELSPATIKHCLGIVRAVFNYAIKEELYDRINPIKRVTLPKFDNAKSRFLKPEEAKALLDELKTRSQDWYDITFVSLFTGMRLGEILSLTWNDIDLDAKELHIKDTKTVEPRTAYLTDQLLELFTRRKSLSTGELVFTGRRGQKIEKVCKTFERAVAAVGLNDGITDTRQKITFHSLRHSFASHLAEQGEPLFAIMELMGHKSMAMTKRYSKTGDKVKRAAVERLATLTSE